MNINVFNKTHRKGYKEYQKDFEIISNKAAEVLNVSNDYNVSVIFVVDNRMHQINRDYRNIDRTTDVISFALADNTDEYDYVEEELGDIFINVDAAARQAEEYNHSIRREICFLFTHGLLHLNGYDHMTKEDEAEMIKYQKLVLDEYIGRDQ